MPQPTVRDVHLDAMLSNLSVAYTQDLSGYIATRVFPVVGVDKKSDKYYVYPKGDWLRDEARKRADSEESAGGGYVLSDDSYDADVWAYHKDVGDQVRANADSPINVDRDATSFVMTKMMLRVEKQWASDFFTTGVWGTDVTGVSTAPSAGQARQWSDYTNSNPIEDIDRGKRYIKRTTGYNANTLVLGYDVMQSLKNHPDIIERFKYTSSQVITEDILARLFGIERLFVADAVINTAQKGQTDNIQFIHSRHALLAHVASSPGLMVPSAGYTFVWRGISQGLGTTVATRRFRMEHLKADRIEAEMAWDNKRVAQDLGYFWSTIVADPDA